MRSHVRSHPHVAVECTLGVQGQHGEGALNTLWAGLCCCMTLLGTWAGGSVPLSLGTRGDTMALLWGGGYRRGWVLLKRWLWLEGGWEPELGR